MDADIAMRFLLFISLVINVGKLDSVIPQKKLSCPPITPEKLQKIIELEHQKKIIFFSSWCLDCLAHLKKADVKKDIFVAAFDKPERAAATLEKLRIIPERCFFDSGLTKKYMIKKVPSEVRLDE